MPKKSKIVVTCDDCKALNQIMLDKLGVVTCGRCGNVILEKTESEPSAPKGGIGTFLFWTLLLIVGVVVFYNPQDKPDTTSLSGSDSRYIASAPEFNKLKQSVSPGIIHPPISPGLAPLEIVTTSGNDYYIKLVTTGGNEVMSFYITGGQSLKVSVPLGTFQLRYASGNTWYGAEDTCLWENIACLFGPETVYSATQSAFDFTKDSSGYNGYVVELIRQEGGNLNARRIDASSF